MTKTTFSQFVCESNYDGPRTAKLTRDQFTELIKNNCSKNIRTMIQSKKGIWRGSWQDKGMYALMDSDKATEKRKAANVRNYSNLILSNSKLWDKFPKRDESFICSSAFSYAKKYSRSDPHLIIPFDNVSIGVCPAEDIFDSFDNVPYQELPQFYTYVGHDTGIKFDEYNWDNFKEQNALLNRYFTSGEYKTKMHTIEEALSEYFKFRDKDKVDFIDRCKKNGILETFERELSPFTNGFNLTKDISTVPSNREVWFSGKAVAVANAEVSSHPFAMLEVFAEDAGIDYK